MSKAVKKAYREYQAINFECLHGDGLSMKQWAINIAERFPTTPVYEPVMEWLVNKGIWSYA